MARMPIYSLILPDRQVECHPRIFRHLVVIALAEPATYGTRIMNIGTILIVLLVLFLIGALPTWPHSANWGYYPSGGLGIVVIVLIVLLLTGRL